MTIRVGVLGAGFMGGVHARALVQVDGVEIAGIYGRSEDRVVPLAAELGVPWTTDLNQLIDDPTIDAIDNCLPAAQHREPLERALAQGKHALVEKPIALTLTEAEDMVSLAEGTDRVVMIAHVLRFWPEYVALREHALSGEMGQPKHALAWRRQPFPAWSGLFAHSDLTGGGVLDQMIHDFDVLNWILGTPQSVVATGLRNPKSGGWDQVQVLLDYGHASALVDGGAMMPDSATFESAIHLLCESGSLQYHFQPSGRGVESGGGRNELRIFPSEGESRVLTVDQSDPYLNEVRYWIDCIRSGQPAAIASPAAATLALRTALAARKSIETGELTAIPV